MFFLRLAFPPYSASAMRSAGGIRQQFSLKENIEMTKYGIDFIRKLPEKASRAFAFGATSDSLKVCIQPNR